MTTVSELKQSLQNQDPNAEVLFEAQGPADVVVVEHKGDVYIGTPEAIDELFATEDDEEDEDDDSFEDDEEDGDDLDDTDDEEDDDI